MGSGVSEAVAKLIGWLDGSGESCRSDAGHRRASAVSEAVDFRDP
jgi:hypothetical protein